MQLQVIRFYGTRRSGHHAVWQWVARQINGMVVNLNNLQTEFGTPYAFMDGTLQQADERYYRTIDPPMLLNRDQPISHVTYNFESYAPSAFSPPARLMPTPEDWPTRHVLVLRDPLNLVASRVRHFRNTEVSIFVKPNAYYAYIAWCKAVMSGSLPVHPCTVVNYNRWFLDRDYRRSLAEELNIPFSDRGIEQVAEAGGGSSFDGQKFEGHAQKMDVLNRYQAMKDDQIFQATVLEFAADFKLITEQLFAGLVDYSFSFAPNKP